MIIQLLSYFIVLATMPLKSFMICMTPIVRMTQKNNKKKGDSSLKSTHQSCKRKTIKEVCKCLPYICIAIPGLQQKSQQQKCKQGQCCRIAGKISLTINSHEPRSLYKITNNMSTQLSHQLLSIVIVHHQMVYTMNKKSLTV